MSDHSQPKKRHNYPPRYDARRGALGRRLPPGYRMAQVALSGIPSPEKARAMLTGIKLQLGVTSGTIAAFLGVPIATVRSWEQGKRRPCAIARTVLAKLAHDVGLDFEWQDPVHAFIEMLGDRDKAAAMKQA